jgi:hypothetical protein
MAFFRKRPVEIEAWQVGSAEPQPDWVRYGEIEFGYVDFCGHDVYFLPRKGDSTTQISAHHGDWIIKDALGKVSSCNEQAFAILYEQITNPASAPSPS